MSLGRHLKDLFAGNWEASTFDRPLLQWPEYARIRRESEECARRPILWQPPIVQASALNIHVLACPGVRSCGAEFTTANSVMCRAGLGPVELGGNIVHGVGHVLGFRYPSMVSEADVWFVAAEMSAPASLIFGWDADQLLQQQPHVPPWLLLPWLSFVNERRWDPWSNANTTWQGAAWR